MEIHYYRDAHDTAKHIETVESVQWVDGFAMPSGYEIIFKRVSDENEVRIPFTNFICVVSNDASSVKHDSMERLLRKAIASHNAFIATLSEFNIPVPVDRLFDGMAVWHKLACAGADLTHMARKAGINAKVNMQTGEIIVREGE